jgi:Domain of unknown function (DUF4288)
MTWYAAHIVMVVRLKRGPQRRFPAWENVVLIQAAGEEAAICKAEAVGISSSGDEDESFLWGGKPASWEFAGIRKVTECSLMGDRPASGDEITFSELDFESLAAAKRYASGRPATVRHQDQIQVLVEREFAAAKPRRKRA